MHFIAVWLNLKAGNRRKYLKTIILSELFDYLNGNDSWATFCKYGKDARIFTELYKTGSLI